MIDERAQRIKDITLATVRAIRAYDALVALVGSEAQANAQMANTRRTLDEHKRVIDEWHAHQKARL